MVNIFGDCISPNYSSGVSYSNSTFLDLKKIFTLTASISYASSDCFFPPTDPNAELPFKQKKSSDISMLSLSRITSSCPDHKEREGMTRA